MLRVSVVKNFISSRINGSSMSTYQHLTNLILAQGIAREPDIHPGADLVDDLGYDHHDIAELARMVQQTFQVQIEPDEYTSFTTVKAIVSLLNNRHRYTLTESFSDYSSLG